MEKKFWQGTNFWTALTIAFGGFFVGFSEADVTPLVTGVFAITGSVFALREKFKGLVPFKEWITGSNTWNYLGSAIVAIVPAIPTELFTNLQGLLTSILGGNWQGITVGVFSIATILYNLVKKK